MEIRFYNVPIDGRYADKSAFLVNPTTKNITLKNNPTNTNKFELDLNGSTTSYTYNYCFIPRYNKYYFIGEPISLNNSMTRLVLECDFLSTYRDKILELECMIERSESHSNAYIQDNNYPVLSYTKPIIKNFPNSMSDDSIILMTVG